MTLVVVAFVGIEFHCHYCHPSPEISIEQNLLLPDNNGIRFNSFTRMGLKGMI
jgi:molybdenum cofactor biosynthesis enzyme MoaA